MKIIIIIAVIASVFYIVQNFINGKSSVSAEANVQAGEDFLTDNATKEGVKTTETGLQYLMLTPGQGEVHPSASSKVEVHYHGTLLDGTVFDSSVDRGQSIEFGLNQVIPGWTEGLQLMVVGEKTRLFIPSRLAYGNSSAGGIQGGSLLIFDVELLAIN